jgi:hypothetical protein
MKFGNIDFPDYRGGDVVDGRGEEIKRRNASFHQLVGIAAQQYRNTKRHQTKRSIAIQIYQIIKEANCKFLMKDGKEKEYEKSIIKVMKSLRDFNKRKRHLTPNAGSVTNVSTVTAPSVTISTKRMQTIPPEPAVISAVLTLSKPSDAMSQVVDSMASHDSNLIVVHKKQGIDACSSASIDDCSLDSEDFFEMLDDASFSTASWNNMMQNQDQIAVDGCIVTPAIDALTTEGNVPICASYENSVASVACEPNFNVAGNEQDNDKCSAASVDQVSLDGQSFPIDLDDLYFSDTMMKNQGQAAVDDCKNTRTHDGNSATISHKNLMTGNTEQQPTSLVPTIPNEIIMNHFVPHDPGNDDSVSVYSNDTSSAMATWSEPTASVLHDDGMFLPIDDDIDLFVLRVFHSSS